MSQRNLDMIRSGERAFNGGDMTPAKGDLAPDLDWGAIGAFPGLSGVYHGHDGIDEWMETVRSAWVEFEASLERVLRDDDDIAVVAEHLRARGRESGAEVEMRIYSVYWFGGGKILKRRAFTSEEEALAAAEGSDPEPKGV